MKNTDFRTDRYYNNNKCACGSDFDDVLSAHLTNDINQYNMNLKNETSMKAIQTIFCLLILLISSVWSFGQSDEVIAGFEYPEFPALCNSEIGVKVTCNEEFII